MRLFFAALIASVVADEADVDLSTARLDTWSKVSPKQHGFLDDRKKKSPEPSWPCGDGLAEARIARALGCLGE